MRIPNITPATNIFTYSVGAMKRVFKPSSQASAVPTAKQFAEMSCRLQNSDPIEYKKMLVHEIDEVNRILFGRIRNFTISEYENLTEREIDCLNEVVNKYLYDNPLEGNLAENFDRCLVYTDIVAECFKKKLDSMYGAGNYVFIPIGRSLSTIGKSLGYKIGEDSIKQLPISNAKRFLNLEKCNEDFDALIKYLNSIGLSKKEIKKSGKHYIFADYCDTGRSLRGVKNLLTSDRIYGNSDNLHFEDVMEFLSDVLPKKVPSECVPYKYPDFGADFKSMLAWGHFKKYSLSDKCYSLNETKNMVIKPEKYEYEMNLFLFKLLDNEMKQRKRLDLVA